MVSRLHEGDTQVSKSQQEVWFTLQGAQLRSQFIQITSKSLWDPTAGRKKKKMLAAPVAKRGDLNSVSAVPPPLHPTAVLKRVMTMTMKLNDRECELLDWSGKLAVDDICKASFWPRETYPPTPQLCNLCRRDLNFYTRGAPLREAEKQRRRK